jgi:hypothetical protein
MAAAVCSGGLHGPKQVRRHAEAANELELLLLLLLLLLLCASPPGEEGVAVAEGEEAAQPAGQHETPTAAAAAAAVMLCLVSAHVELSRQLLPALARNAASGHLHKQGFG